MVSRNEEKREGERREEEEERNPDREGVCQREEVTTTIFRLFLL